MNCFLHVYPYSGHDFIVELMTEKVSYLIGRKGYLCDISIEDKRVSRQQATLTWDKGRQCWFVYDGKPLSSTRSSNGTHYWQNGQVELGSEIQNLPTSLLKIFAKAKMLGESPQILSNNDIIVVGHSLILVQCLSAKVEPSSGTLT